MSEVSGHKSHRAEYYKVFFVLTLLTIIELVIPHFTLSQFAKGSSLTFLALGKACIVGWSYMHLKDETKWMRFIALIPISAFFYAAFVVLESMYR
ncbi:MAG TPA: cytochrome C oxidase subunit IV family protein [Bacteriovoracaceae bacterium]|nr:cytochrome C oxidase subunit IV family protein [Bacteriovoracaceae bacterium]